MAVAACRSSDDDDNSSAPRPPDGGWGWVVVFGSFMIHIIADGVTYTFGIFFVEFLHYYGESKGATSWILSILVGITLGTGPIASALTNKYGCRIVTIAGAILASIGFFLSIFAPNITTLYFTIGICGGFGFGLIYLPAIVTVTCYFEKRRAFATGIAVCGSGLGTFIFAPLIEMLVEMYSWRGAMLIVAGLILNCCVFGALFRPMTSSSPRVRRCTRDEVASAIEMKQLVNGLPPPGFESTDLAKPQLQKLLASNGHAIEAKEGLRLSASAHNLMHPSQHSVLRTSTNPHRLGGLGSNRSLLIKPTPREEEVPIDEHAPLGPMYRKDIFYSGSLLNLPQYRRVLSWPFYPALSWAGTPDFIMRSSLERSNPQMYAMSITHIPKATEVDGKQSTCCSWSKETKDTLKEMMDMSILKDPIFVLFAISNFCTSIGFNVPYVYIKDRAILHGLNGEQSSYLISIIGIANTISRVILGYVSDKPWLNRLWLYNSSLTICGLATMFSAFCVDYTSMGVYAAVFGATAGAYVGLTSVILVDLLGLEKLTNAFGLLLLFQGVASLVGPPIIGSLYDSMRSYDPGFYVAGAMIAISGAMLFAIPAIRWCQQKNHVPHGTADIPELTVYSAEEGSSPVS